LVLANLGQPLMSLSTLLKEPLLHFTLLGGLLFAGHAVWQDGRGGEEVVVDSARIKALHSQFQNTWQRPPSAEEARGLLDAWLREELMYREGLAQGLDRDDPVVKRRVAQKLGQLAEAQVSSETSETELQAWLAAHPQLYTQGPRLSFTQRFFDPQQRGPKLERDLAAARAALDQGSKAAWGDATLLPAEMTSVSAAEIERNFGTDFAAALADLPVGAWSGAIESDFGVHLVRLQQREPAVIPALAQVRVAVERDLLRERMKAADEAHYRALRARYTVRIEEPTRPTAKDQTIGAAGLPERLR
jgi:hypothetical protein